MGKLLIYTVLNGQNALGNVKISTYVTATFKCMVSMEGVADKKNVKLNFRNCIKTKDMKTFLWLEGKLNEEGELDSVMIVRIRCE